MYITKYGCVFMKLGERTYVATSGYHSHTLLGSLPLAHPASSPSIRRTVVLVSSSPSGHRPVCIAAVKLTQWTIYDYEKSHWTCYFGTCRSDIRCV